MILTITKIYYYPILLLIFAIFIDLIFGELPAKIHPVVLIGKLIDFLSKLLLKFKNKLSGLFLLLLTTTISTVILFLLLNILLKISFIIFTIISIVMLSSTFSIKLLLSSANKIKEDLIADINIARKSVSYLVSRNTKELSERFIISATIESLSENIVDSYISPIFYYIIFLIICISLSIKNFYIYLILIPFIYRISNTLDAMVGYKNEKLIHIGFIPAKFDDILNFIPSRIGGFILILAAFLLKFNWKNSYKILLRDSNRCNSPNSGYTMAATAGALNVQLNKKNEYTLGDNNKSLEINDIDNAINLSRLSIFLFTFFSIILTTMVWCLK